MLEFIVKGGLVLWIIMALSAVGVAIIVERLVYFRKIRVDEEKLFLPEFRQQLAEKILAGVTKFAASMRE